MSRRAWVEQLMGMPMSIHVRADDPNRSDIERAVQAAYTELARMEDLFTTYRADSQLSRLRRGELTFAGCDPLVAAARDLGFNIGPEMSRFHDPELPQDGILVAVTEKRTKAELDALVHGLRTTLK